MQGIRGARVQYACEIINTGSAEGASSWERSWFERNNYIDENGEPQPELYIEAIAGGFLTVTYRIAAENGAPALLLTDAYTNAGRVLKSGGQALDRFMAVGLAPRTGGLPPRGALRLKLTRDGHYDVVPR